MPSEKGIVHVIDDDEALRESLAFLLRTANIEVRTYASAVAFLDALPDARASCVITDVRMPGMSGIELLRRLQELKIAMPVIVITGHGDVPLAVEAMKIGALDFLEKPFDDEVLLTSVRSALMQAGRRDQTPYRASGDREQTRSPLQSRTRRAWRAGGGPGQ